LKYKFTVFTPTYNRAYTLQRVFDSLMDQTIDHCDFEWILINDGSTDESDALVATFFSRADFEIRYIKHENRGKNYCHNEAVTMAKGELFLILDSDDAVTPECMEVFWSYWIKIPQDNKQEMYGVSCLCKDGYTNKLIGEKVEEGLIEDAFVWKHKNRIYFETWGALNTLLFKRYLFPEVDEITFIPEAYVWDRVAKGRRVYSTNEILRIVFHQDDGFSKYITESYIKHSKGRYLYHRMVLNDLFLDLLKANPIRLLKDFIQFGRMGFHSNYSLKKMMKDINSSYKIIFFSFIILLSVLCYKKDIKNGE